MDTGAYRVKRHFVGIRLLCSQNYHYECRDSVMTLKSTITYGFNFQIINSLMDS